VSNPDSYGPYWQDKDDASYGSGWRGGPSPTSRQQPAWDDGNGFWRDDRGSGRAGRDGRPGRHGAAQHRDGQSPARGSRREPQRDDAWGSHSNAGRSAGRARSSADSDRGDWTGRLGQTADDLRSKADDLRSKLSSRTRSAASRVNDRVQARLRGAGEDGAGYGAMGGNEAPDGGRGRSGRGVAGSADDRFWAEAGGSRGGRRAAHTGGYGRGDYGPGDYGPGDYGTGGYDGRRAGGRTATRERGDFWDDPDRTSRGTRTRIAERQATRGGGNGHGGGGWGGGHGGGRYGRGPRNRGGGFKNWLLYGSWWRHWTLKKALAVVGAGIAACFLLGIGVFFLLYEMTPIPTAKELTANWQSSTVYLANGHQMGIFDGGGIDRVLLSSGQIPPVMTHAMTAAEDRHFYTEGGVSLTGLLRAAYEDLRGIPQGGSTITMQYAKNYYAGVNTGQNLSTELKEIFIAMKLGHDQTKTEIMTNYLNTVPFGATIDGLGAAAESYFDVNLTQDPNLTVAQAAMLAAMPNNPAVFSSGLAGTDPLGLSLLKARFNYVLANMVRDGNISQTQANATTFPKLTPPPSGNGETGYTGYLMQMVEQQLEAPKADGGYGLTQHRIDTGGYRITTTFSMAKVNALARAVSEEKNQMKLAAEEQGADSFRKYDRIGAVLENSKTGAILAVYGGPGYGSQRCNITDCDINMAEAAEPVGSSFKPYVLSEAVKLGMNVMTSKLNGYSPIWIPLSSSVESPSVTQMSLSPTSPPAGCQNATATSGGGNCLSNGTEYFVFNEPTENFHTGLPVNVAAAVSSDPAFEDLAHRDGDDNVIKMAQELGVGQTAFVDPCPESNGTSYLNTLEECNDLTGPVNGLIPNFGTTHPSKLAMSNGTPGSPAIALGENPLTPIEQASTFATLADDGVYHTPHVIQSLELNNGKPVPSPVVTRQVLTPPQATDVDWALSFDNNLDQGGGEVGTAENTVSFARGNLIAKTGTLGTGANASQAWFNGATRRGWALTVALFTNLPATQNLDNLPSAEGTQGSLGGAWPASIFNAYMMRNVNSLQILQLLPPVTTNFQTWIRVKPQAPKKQFCKPGHGGLFGGLGGGNQGCICPPHATFCGNHPNPGTSCNGNGFGNGNCSSPSPSSTCQGGVAGFGGQCSSSPPADTPSPSATPSATPSVGAQTTSFLRSPPVSAGILTVAGEENSTKLAALLGLII
jgi:membrane peptidoglycan carboxypeptidase